MNTKRAEFLRGLGDEFGMSAAATEATWTNICNRMQEEGQSPLFAQQIESYGECAGWKVARTLADAINTMDDPAAEVICRFAQLPAYRD